MSHPKAVGSLPQFLLLALKEYEQEKERLDFLQTQREDLIKARKNLTDSIDIINATARKQFLQTFEEVQKNFSQADLKIHLYYCIPLLCRFCGYEDCKVREESKTESFDWNVNKLIGKPIYTWEND